MEAWGCSGGPHNNFRTSCLTACRKQGDGVGVKVLGGGGRERGGGLVLTTSMREACPQHPAGESIQLEFQSSLSTGR